MLVASVVDIAVPTFITLLFRALILPDTERVEVIPKVPATWALPVDPLTVNLLFATVKFCGIFMSFSNVTWATPPEKMLTNLFQNLLYLLLQH